MYLLYEPNPILLGKRVKKASHLAMLAVVAADIGNEEEAKGWEGNGIIELGKRDGERGGGRGRGRGLCSG